MEKKIGEKVKRDQPSTFLGTADIFITGPNDNDIVVMFDSLRMKGEALMELELSA